MQVYPRDHHRGKKRQRREHQQEEVFLGPEHVPPFLPTHLSLLRALHADDETAAGADSADSACPRPSWVEVNKFVVLQRSMMKLDFQTKRIKGVSVFLLPPNTLAAAGQNERPHEQERRLQMGSGIEDTRPLDPRSVVSAVLRRASKERENEHLSTLAGLRGLLESVGNTVDHLSSSLEELARSRRDGATPWRRDCGEKDKQGANAADMLERHRSKLLLWRRLQAALRFVAPLDHR